MNIYPEDLGPKVCGRVLQIRFAMNDLLPPLKIAGCTQGVGSQYLTPPMPLSSAALAKLALPEGYIGGIMGVGVGVWLGLISAGGLARQPPSAAVCSVSVAASWAFLLALASEVWSSVRKSRGRRSAL